LLETSLPDLIGGIVEPIEIDDSIHFF